MGNMHIPILVVAAFVQFVAAADPIDIGSRLELLVDDYLIDTVQGTEMRLHQPTLREVVIVHDEPWEGNACGYHTVLQDGDRYRMYYRGHSYTLGAGNFGEAHREVICYAESSDGIHWTKPNLGLVSFNDSTENNILWDGQGSHNFTPFIDRNPKCAPDAIYKALGGITDGLYTFESADGIHWIQTSDAPVITAGAFDSQNVGFWDETRGHYVAYFRTFVETEGKSMRSIAMTTSPDFRLWSDPVPLTYPGAPAEQLYTNQVLPYFRAPHLLLGFPTRYVDRPLTDHVQTIEPVALRKLLIESHQRIGTDLTDGVFMSSRDGVTFNRWGEAFLRPGPQARGNWLYGSMYQNWGLVETRWDASGGRLPALEHLDVPGELSLYVSEGAWSDTENRMRRYTLRLDGFVSMQAPLRGGEFTTRPILFAGDRLVINYATSAAGSLRVEIQEASGAPIEGFSLSDCPDLYGDAIAQAVSWTGAPSLAALAGTPIRLRFVLRDADLYAFQFRTGE